MKILIGTGYNITRSIVLKPPGRNSHFFPIPSRVIVQFVIHIAETKIRKRSVVNMHNHVLDYNQMTYYGSSPLNKEQIGRFIPGLTDNQVGVLTFQRPPFKFDLEVSWRLPNTNEWVRKRQTFYPNPRYKKEEPSESRNRQVR